jgi:hypothetical protein
MEISESTFDGNDCSLDAQDICGRLETADLHICVRQVKLSRQYVFDLRYSCKMSLGGESFADLSGL